MLCLLDGREKERLFDEYSSVYLFFRCPFRLTVRRRNQQRTSVYKYPLTQCLWLTSSLLIKASYSWPQEMTSLK